MFKDIIKFFQKKKAEQSFIEYVNTSMDESRKIYVTTITSQTAETIDKTITFWNNVDNVEGIESLKREPIRIYINSTGGDFNAMLTILDAIKLSKTPVYTINIGTAYKEAFFVYLAGYKILFINT